MKVIVKVICIVAAVMLCITLYYNAFNVYEEPYLNSELLRIKHKKALKLSPYYDTPIYSKKDRFALRLPPNKYNEELWNLTLDPVTGRPMPENLIKIKERQNSFREVARGVGDSENPWIDRGPNNVGGRTRAIMFDPNDVSDPPSTDDFKRVFAGGVSGGLWLNDDITDQNSKWQLVDGVDGTLSISVMIYDPNDTDTFYIGTGESYTFGRAVGTGIWKSEDAGITWTRIFGGYQGISGNNVEGIFYINDLVARDNDGVTELYAAVSVGLYDLANAPRQTMSKESYGVYKTNDGGIFWERLNIKAPNGEYENPNDLEIDSDNNVWVTSTENLNRSGGGDIFKSTDGIDFTLVNTIPNARRTEIEISFGDPNVVWVAANIGDKADLFKSKDGFSTFVTMNEPNDADEGIPQDDFTRGQAFYDLEIEADTNNNLFVGGIDLFRSEDDGETWVQISKWSNSPGLAPLNIPLVHPDQHAIIFRPNSNDKLVFGNDGGVYYTDNVLQANMNENAISERNKDYNTVQFYSGTMDVSKISDESFAGGTQDNGTQVKLNASEGSNGFTDFFGGDGGYTEIDGEDGYMIQSYYYNDHRYVNYPEIDETYQISTLRTDGNDNGNFINIAELDRNLNILYSNASNGQNFRIEKISNFLNGKDNIQTEFLSDPILDSRPSALKSTVYTNNTSVLYIGTITGKLFKVVISENSNIWTEISGGDFVGSISDIELGTNDSELFVTMHNYGVQSVWASMDEGSTWRSIEGDLPDLPVKCILQNPLRPEELIIGTELGVWITPNFTIDSPSWIQSYNGMSDVTVVDLDLRPGDNKVLATTHGRGLFTSNFTAESLNLDENKLTDSYFTVFPVISDGHLFLKSDNLNGLAEVKVYNVSGAIIYATKSNLTQAGGRLALNFKPGIYFVNIQVNNLSETKRIIIR